MPEYGPRIPEKLTGQNPENIARLTDRLIQTLASLPEGANYRTDEMIKQDGVFLLERLDQQKRGFLGLGRKRVDVENPDHLWVATQILYPEKEALETYFITASALIRALGKNVEGKTAEAIHNKLIKDKDKSLLNKLNSSQIIHGDYAVLDILDDLIKEQPAKEEAKESAVETADYAVLDASHGYNKGKQAENKDFVAKNKKGDLFVVADGSHGGSLFENPQNSMQQLYADFKSTPSMANSIVAALIKGHNLHLANSGDSKAYLLRDGQLTLLTDDDETQKTIPLQKGDQVLLCTDGLWGPVNDQTIAAILSSSKNSEEAVKQLIIAAYYGGGEQADNIGVSVINVENLVKGKIKAQTKTIPAETTQEEPATPDVKYARVAHERNLEPVGGYWMNLDGLNYKTFYGGTARIPDKYDPSEVEKRVGRVGKYNANDGKITVVGADGSMYIGLITEENISALEAANYQKDASLPTEFSEGDYPTDPEVRRLYLDFIEGKKVADTE